MPISELTIENFKGILDRQEFVIRPITIFCGPNSSGKSSCIHALAAMAQTTKLAASQIPIVLDDEFAQVHLGRFLDVIHSKSLRDSFKIGVSVDDPESVVVRAKERPKGPPRVHAEYEFRARIPSTQEVYIASANLCISEDRFVFDRLRLSKPEYAISFNGKKLSFSAMLPSRFGFQVRPSLRRGAEPDEMEMGAFFATESVNRSLSAELRRTMYLGPFRQGPLRKYSTRGAQPTEVGAAGESAVTMLANEFARSRTRHPNLRKVSQWIAQLGLGKKLLVSPVAKTDLVDVTVTMADGAELPLPDLGYGVSQVLPVLVQCAFAPKSSTLLFEQPELHLHDAAAKKLASVFVDTVKDRDIHIVAETHSRALFLEIMREVKVGRLSADQVVLYDVSRENGKSVFRRVNIVKDDDGHCEADHPWAKGLDA